MTIDPVRIFVGWCLAAGACVGSLPAQSPPRSPPADTLRPLTVGYGVDTTAVSPYWGGGPWRAAVPEIYRTWREYLHQRHAEPAGTGAGRIAPRSRFWNAAEQTRWPDYDLAGGLAYQGFRTTVLGIRPARPTRLDESSDEFVVQTLFAQVDTSAGGMDVRPVALTRVLARREQGRWVFANVLESMTRNWPRRQVGAVTYIVHPEHRFDPARAAHAVRFADSLATAFEVPRLKHLDYYVTDNPDDMFRLLGIDWTITADPHGAGQAFQRNGQIFVGAPALGEEYLHEIAHAVLGMVTPSQAHPMLAEGLATWVGGSLGYGPAELRTQYARYLRAHPAVTLDTVLTEEGGDYGLRPGVATLFQLAFARGGMTAVRTLLGAGRSPLELRAAVTRALGLPWEDVVALWKREVLAPPTVGTSHARDPASARRP